jgi:quercetin dioxygenase-like cupin family protein
MSDIASDLFLIGSEIPWETIDDKVSRQIVGFNDSIMMVKVKFKEGGIGPVHDHYHSQVTYVVSGAFPPHVSHGAVCKEEGMLIDVFSPHREDFLSK